jgi:acetyl-CoA carboxylase biotin carboxyl carrier protein
MDLRQLKSIMKEFEESTIHKLEISEKDFTVKLEKKGNDPMNPVSQSYTPIEVVNQTEEIKTEINSNVLIKAPLVGTFYDSSSPDSESFISLNKKVSKGDVLFIVEAMKVMNEITSPVSGIVRKIHVSNATVVEFGQVVLEIEE